VTQGKIFRFCTCTTEQQQEIAECWLQHRELSIVARRQKARTFDK
jgi:hypothetical protein